MDAWLSRVRDALAEAAEMPRDQLELTAEASATLLELARLAAHDGGERTNAPLLCYLLGRAENDEAGLETLAAAVRSTS